MQVSDRGNGKTALARRGFGVVLLTCALAAGLFPGTAGADGGFSVIDRDGAVWGYPARTVSLFAPSEELKPGAEGKYRFSVRNGTDCNLACVLDMQAYGTPAPEEDRVELHMQYRLRTAEGAWLAGGPDEWLLSGDPWEAVLEAGMSCDLVLDWRWPFGLSEEDTKASAALARGENPRLHLELQIGAEQIVDPDDPEDPDGPADPVDPDDPADPDVPDRPNTNDSGPNAPDGLGADASGSSGDGSRAVQAAAGGGGAMPVLPGRLAKTGDATDAAALVVAAAFAATGLVLVALPAPRRRDAGAKEAPHD